MADRRHRAGLVEEALHAVALSRCSRVEDLDRDTAAQRHVHAQEHLAHRAEPQSPLEAELAQDPHGQAAGRQRVEEFVCHGAQRVGLRT